MRTTPLYFRIEVPQKIFACNWELVSVPQQHSEVSSFFAFLVFFVFAISITSKFPIPIENQGRGPKLVRKLSITVISSVSIVNCITFIQTRLSNCATRHCCIHHQYHIWVAEGHLKLWSFQKLPPHQPLTLLFRTTSLKIVHLILLPNFWTTLTQNNGGGWHWILIIRRKSM